MAFELVYISQAGNRSYWTTTQHFTKSPESHYQWEGREQVVADFDQLKQQYPTIFGPKKTTRFFISEVGSDHDEPLTTAVQTAEEVEPKKDNEAGWPKWVGPQMVKQITNDRALYAIAVDYQDNYHFLDTTLNDNGGLIAPFSDQVRRWKEAAKAVATANTLAVNKSFWANYPNIDQQVMLVINLRTGEVIWSTNHNEQTASSWQVTQLNNQLDQLSLRIEHHLQSSGQGQLTVTETTKDCPSFDLEQYNASQFFACFKYVLQCLNRRSEINQLLGRYDGEVLQDQLHLIELTDLSTVDLAQFAEYLQTTRRHRRQVKDLAVLVNIVAENTDTKEIIKQLNDNQSLSTTYQYRDRQAAAKLQAMLKQPASEG